MSDWGQNTDDSVDGSPYVQQLEFKLVPGFKPQATSAQATSHKLLDRGSRIKYRGASTVALD